MRLLTAVLFEGIKEVVSSLKTGTVGLGDLVSLAHGLARERIGGLELEGELPVSDDARQEHAHGVRDGQAHRGKRLGGLGLELFIDAHVKHCGSSHGDLLVYQLRYIVSHLGSLTGCCWSGQRGPARCRKNDRFCGMLVLNDTDSLIYVYNCNGSGCSIVLSKFKAEEFSEAKLSKTAPQSSIANRDVNMIVGIFLRNIKTYRGINYIPLTDEDKFSGLVGDNGIGKSSVLEALDVLFNGRPVNLNIITKRSGLSETHPHIVPIFLFKKEDFGGNSDLSRVVEALSELAVSVAEGDVNPANRSHIRKYIAHRDALSSNLDLSLYYVLPIGVDYDGKVSISIFNCRKLVELLAGEGADSTINSMGEQEIEDNFKILLDEVRERLDYIYIPKEIDSESFTKLETKEIQALMGESMNEILSSRVTQATIQDINKNLNKFIDDLSAELGVYTYRTPTDRQQNLRKQDVYNLIIEAFFNIRKLHKKQGDSWLEINHLSSGEKQKAIIEVASNLIAHHRLSAENLILAIDEPESSLHMSACFDQFDKLYRISRSCRQLIFSSHWYGFFPAMETGNAAVITKKDDEHRIDLINLPRHREQVKQLVGGSRNSLPFDVRLKSINDFVQSIMTSAMGGNPFNWLICEGSSEKLYFSYYFKDLIDGNRLRIVPVGGAKEVKRAYQHLSAAYDDMRTEIKGKIFLLSDTDRELVNYDVMNYPNLVCKRMVNDEASKLTRLVTIQSNPVSPPTEIEDALNGKLFYEALLTFVEQHSDLAFLREVSVENEGPVYFALDIKPSQRESIVKFFDAGNNKFEFAKKYVSLATKEYATPGWIDEIRGFISSV